MRRDDRLVSSEPAVHQSVHDLIALHVEPAFGIGLRDAARQLAVTQVVIRCDGNLPGTSGLGIRGVLPVDMNLPEVDTIVFKDVF